LPQERVQSLDGGDEGKTQYIAAQRPSVVPFQSPQRHQVHRDITLDRPAHDHATGRVSRRDVNETALRERASRFALGFLLVLFRKDFQCRVIECRIVLCRTRQNIDIPGADHRLHDARKFGLGIS